MSVESNLGRNGVAVIKSFMDLGPIADLRKTIGQIPIEMYTNSTNMIIEDSPVTLLPWRPVCPAIMEEFEKKKSQICVLDSRAIKSWQFVHFHIKEKSYSKRMVVPGRGVVPGLGRIFVSIPIQLDAGYPSFVKGSHNKPLSESQALDRDPNQEFVEILLDVGSVLLWYGETELVYPIVSSFERGGGFAIILGY